MQPMKEIQKQIVRLTIIKGAFQDEITSGLIRSLTQIQKEEGCQKALSLSEVFLKAIYLYEEGLPVATALLASSELNKEKKNVVQMLGYAAICVSSVLPYILLDQTKFENFVDDLREQAKNEVDRKKSRTMARVTKLKPRARKKA